MKIVRTPNQCEPHLECQVGKVFGTVTVVEFMGRDERREDWYRVKYDSGKEQFSTGYNLRCGKYFTGNQRYNKEDATLRKVHSGILQRALNTDSQKYAKYYSDVSICEEWLTPHKFISWAKTSGYRVGLSIERVDNTGDYCPENCIWANSKTQARNKRNNILTVDVVREMRKMYRGGARNIDVASKFNMDSSYTHRVVTNKVWKENHG